MDNSLNIEIIQNDNQSSVSDSHLEEKINEIQDKSQLYYENALDTFQKKQYKKTLTYIETILPELEEKYYWRALYLKLTCYQEIIELKIQKYYNKSYLTSATKYFSLFNENIKKFFIELKKNPKNPEHLNKCECVISLILRQCYNYAQFCIHQDFLYDCIGFLSIGERLIRNTAKFFISPDSNYYASCIFLFLSTMFIISDNFGNAKKYIILCLKLSYIELELRLDINDTFSLVDLGIFKEEEQEKINKIFFNLAICFFHLGICYEHEYEIESAYHAYKQAKWFSHAIPNDELINLVVSLFNMEKRELLRLKLIEFFKKEEKDVQQEKKEPKPKPKIWFDEETNLKKYEKLEEYITKMKLREVDDDDPDLLNKVHGKPFSKQVGIPTKTIHILNYLMDDKFKNVVEKMKKLEINCLSKQTKDIIQKQILNIKNEERVKDSEKAKEKEEREKKLKDEEIKLKDEENKLKDEENKLKEDESKLKEEKKIINEDENIIREKEKLIKENEDKLKKENEKKEEKNEDNKEEENKEKEYLEKKINEDEKIIKTEVNEEKKVETIQKKIIENIKRKKIIIKKEKKKIFSKYKVLSQTNLESSTNNSHKYCLTFSGDKIDDNKKIITSYNKINKRNNRLSIRTSINCSDRSKTLPNYKRENEIEKITYDHFIFNKSFKAKKKYLDAQFNRELIFQKNLLKSKNGGNGLYENNIFDERKTKMNCEKFFEKTLESEMKLALEKDIKKEEQKKNTIIENPDINIFRIQSRFMGKLIKKKKDNIIPEVENRKFIDHLTSQIEDIDNVKKYLLKSYQRSLKKNS